jgi:5-methylcytosine-specific restriction protein A
LGSKIRWHYFLYANYCIAPTGNLCPLEGKMSVFDEIAKRTPINRPTLNVASEGNHFSFDSKYLNNVRSDIPLPITTRQLSAGKEDMTGRVFGRLTVIGQADRPTNAWGKMRWVVRCACGFYELRRSSGLREGRMEAQMCSACQQLEERKAGRGPWLNTPKTKRAKHRANLQLEPKQPIVLALRSEAPKFIPSGKMHFPKTPIPPELRWRVWERDNFTCQNCGSRKHLAVDHILAESKGGMMVLSNLQTLCGRCNSKKGAR